MSSNKPVVKIERIEVVQSVQDNRQSVPLIKGKKTFARLPIGGIVNAKGGYLTFEGTLECQVFKDSRGGGKPSEVDTIDPVRLPCRYYFDIDQTRNDWNQTLNFDVTNIVRDVPARHSLQFRLYKLSAKDDAGATVPIQITDRGDRRITSQNLLESPALNITALVFRYWDAGLQRYVVPAPENVDLIRQFVSSSFPIDEKCLQWNTIEVQASSTFRSLKASQNYREDTERAASREVRELMLQTIIHRNQDLNSGNGLSQPNTCTLYLGVFDDPSGRLGGAAVDSPKETAFYIVGVALAESTGQIGAHELAHLLGRKHPGIPLRRLHGPILGQRPEDEDTNHSMPKHGFLSDRDRGGIGLHTDPRASNPRVYEYNHWFDLMTYRDPQWLSTYTYQGLLERLKELDAICKTPGISPGENDYLVVGYFDLDKRTGGILYVLPAAYFTNPPADQISRIIIRVYKPLSDTPTDVPVWFRDYDSSDMPTFGIFQVTISVDRSSLIEPAKIDLSIDGLVVDTYVNFRDDATLELFTDHFYNPFTVTRELVDLATTHASGEEKKIGNGWQYMIEEREALLLSYSVETDEYWLRYELPLWIFNVSIAITFQCQNPHQKTWETVAVSRDTRGKIWIRPRLVDKFSSSDSLPSTLSGATCHSPNWREAPWRFGKPDSRPISERANDQLVVRMQFTAGFVTGIGQSQLLKPKLEFPGRNLLNATELEESLGERRISTRIQESLARQQHYRDWLTKFEKDVEDNGGLDTVEKELLLNRIKSEIKKTARNISVIKHPPNRRGSFRSMLYADRE